MPAQHRVLAVACVAAAAVGAAPAAVASSHHLVPGHHNRPLYVVPASIASDCSKPVDHKIESWLRKAPAHAEVEFAHGACYGQKRTITLSHRKDLIIEGNGAKFKTLTSSTKMRTALRFVDDRNLTVKHIHVVGDDHKAQKSNAPYQAVKEWQHGFQVLGSEHVKLSHISAVDVWGDGVNVSYDRRGHPTRSVPSRDVVVRHANLDGTGRHGVGLTDVDGFTIADSSIGHNHWEGIDVEPAVNAEIARHIHVKDNTFGPNGLGMFANFGNGLGHHVGHISIVGNVQTAKPTTCRPSISISTPPGARRAHYRIEDNTLVGISRAVTAHAVNHLDVEHNTIKGFGPPSVCGLTAGVVIDHSTHDVVSHNHFSGRGIDAALDDHTDCKLVQTAHNVVSG